MTSGSGLKIKNIKAATLYGYSLGLRDRYDYTESRFHPSLFSLYMQKNGLRLSEKDRTQDIICLDFDFGFPSYEEENLRLKKLLKAAPDESAAARVKTLMEKAAQSKEIYEKKTKDEIRREFYEKGISLSGWRSSEADTDGAPASYRMLYRNSSKAKSGQTMFINADLYEKAYDWITMGLGKKMPEKNARIVELSAYAPLVTSSILDTLHIPVENILILKDQESFPDHSGCGTGG